VRIASISQAFPSNYYQQEQIFQELGRQWGATPTIMSRLEAFHQRAGVLRRHLALPKEDYEKIKGFSARNREYVRVAVELGAEALSGALAQAEVPPAELDALFFVSVTGMATPSIDARLINRLGLNPALRRTPIFGLGCVAGAAGLARAADFAKAYPEANVALLAVELCSLTWQPDDVSVPNLIASSLFGDGAAAVVLTGEQRGPRGPHVVASRSTFYPNTEEVMGWEIGSQGLKVILSSGVPELVFGNVAKDVDGFLLEHGLARSDIEHWILHTGGPKVLEAFEGALGLPREQLELTWKQLRENGNLSSASVLLVLGDTWRERRPAPGSHSILMAMGPGFCSEMVLLRW
jgi:alkylresorcinol/alkylpyrone synthase